MGIEFHMKSIFIVILFMMAGMGIFGQDLQEENVSDHVTIMASLPPEVNRYLKKHISKYVIPPKAVIKQGLEEYLLDEDVLNHPSFCQGDFNFDGRTDYALILMHYDNEAVLVLLNQREDLWYELFFFGAIEDYTKTYVTFDGAKLVVGTFDRIDNYIIWDRVQKRYKIF